MIDWLDNDHEEIVGFGESENQAFADIILNAFSADELERLANEAEWGWEQVESNRPVGDWL